MARCIRDDRPSPGPGARSRLVGMGGERYLERYLGRSGVIEWDRSSFGPVEADPAAVRAAWLLACIEADSTSQAAKVERAGFARATDVGTFLPHWYEEEQEHGRVLFAVAAAGGIEPPSSARLSSGADQRGQPPGWVGALLGRVPGADAAYLATAAAAEYVARCMYSWLAEAYAGSPVVSRLLRDLAAQEARHLGFYRAAAEARLVRSAPARQLAPSLFTRFWRPVGVDTLGWSIWFDAFGGLITDPVLQRRFLGMDRMVAALPGFEQVAPLRSFLGAHGIAVAA